MTIGSKSSAQAPNPDRGRPARRKFGRVLALPIVAGALLAWPAFASATTFCVNDGSCSGTDEPTVQQALDAASGNTGPDAVQIGAGTYSNPGGFLYDSAAVDNAVTIVGAGQGTTTLQMPGDPNAYEQVLSIDDASSVNDLSIEIPGTPGVNSHQDVGLDLFGASANRVSVSAASSANDDTGVFMSGSGASFVDGAVSLPYGNENRGVSSQGGTGLVRSTVKADTAFSHSSNGEVALLNRVTLMPGAYGFGAWTDAGPIAINNSLINLGSATNAVGLRVANFNGSVSPKSIHADHVTIVGGGPGSRGLQVQATSPVANGEQLATATLTNSTIRGPAVPIDREAQNTSPTNPGLSKANVTTSYSNYNKGAAIGFNGPNGSGAIINYHFVPGTPTFVGRGDFTPRPGSILTDAGNPKFLAGGLDLAGNPRVADGNGDGKAITDLGAYERQP
jgi:hypothetical protein